MGASRRVLTLAIALIGLSWAWAEAWPHHHPRYRWRTVLPAMVRVHDGDTFYAGWETIRLRTIDTPELGQPQALAARRRLAALLGEGPITIVPRAEDVYGRTVADVYVRGRNVADVLRREGFEKPRAR